MKNITFNVTNTNTFSYPQRKPMKICRMNKIPNMLRKENTRDPQLKQSVGYQKKYVKKFNK